MHVPHSFKTEILSEISYISESGFHQLWLRIQVKNFKSFVVCTAYRPPNTTLICFDADLTPSFISASLLGKPIYILGDLNCNLLINENPASQALLNFCRSFNLSQLITKPTRITDSTKPLLDVIIVSNMRQVLKSKVLQSSISDHDLVYVVLRLKSARQKPVHVTTRSFKHYQADGLLSDMSKAPWSIVSIFDDLEDTLHAFNLLFNDILNDHAPMKQIRIRGRPNPCVTEEIRELMKVRDQWRKVARRTNDTLAWSEYKSFKRAVKREIKLAEWKFINQQIKDNPNNTNCMWKTIRSCIHKKSSSQRTFSFQQ